MKTVPAAVDILILGGGPAGAGAALRLQQLGYCVALLEKTCFPRPQIGESLSPGIWMILADLQAEHLLNRPGYLHQLPASVRWESGHAQFVNASQRGPGIMVNRGQLDADLLTVAREQGVHVLQPAAVVSCQRIDDTWLIHFVWNSHRKTIRSRYILDARGRLGALTKQRIHTAPVTVACWTHIAQDQMAQATLIDAVETGWLWGAPLPDGRYRIMAFIDPGTLKTTSPYRMVRGLQKNSTLFKNTSSLPFLSPIQSCSALPYVHAFPWQDHYLYLGEAAFSIDPLSASGVEKALRFSWQAATAVHTLLQTGQADLAQTYYENQLVDIVITHQIAASRYYALAWPGTSYDFWQARAQPRLNYAGSDSTLYGKLLAKRERLTSTTPLIAPTQGLEPSRLSSLWYQNVHLSPELTYQDSICVVGDKLCLKKAIQHPRLAKEVAYLSDVEVAPLLAEVDKVATFGELINRWSQQITFDLAVRLAVYLWNLDILGPRHFC